MNDVNLEGLLRSHQQGWGLEQPFYTHQGIFDFEWEVIWKKYWLFVGTTAEIPKAGDYFTYQATIPSLLFGETRAKCMRTIIHAVTADH